MEVFLKHVVQFTVEADTRKRIGAYGFFVELEEEIGTVFFLLSISMVFSMYYAIYLSL